MPEPCRLRGVDPNVKRRAPPRALSAGGTNWPSNDNYQNQPDSSGPRRHHPRKMHSARFS
jgi:hypothetical protein